MAVTADAQSAYVSVAARVEDVEQVAVLRQCRRGTAAAGRGVDEGEFTAVDCKRTCGSAAGVHGKQQTMVGTEAERALRMQRSHCPAAAISAGGKGAGRPQGAVFMSYVAFDLVARCGIGHHKHR